MIKVQWLIPLVLIGPLLVPMFAALLVRPRRLAMRLTVFGFLFFNTVCLMLFYLATRR